MIEEPCRNRRGSSYIYLALSATARRSEQKVSVRRAVPLRSELLIFKDILVFCHSVHT